MAVKMALILLVNNLIMPAPPQLLTPNGSSRLYSKRG